MRRIRVLVVDDSVVVRQMLTKALQSDPDVEVVGHAANGRLALEKLERCQPDLVTLDVEMPEMDGLETLGEIRKRDPRIPVIMFSTLTESGASVTLDALTRGASDYATKPTGVSSPEQAIEKLREDMLPRVRALTAKILDPSPAETETTQPATTTVPTPRPATPAKPAIVRAARRRGRVDVLAIGVSTGGPDALATLVPELPGDLPVPVVIVQHMPKVFTGLLAERLDHKSPLHVREGVDGAVLRPGEAWLAPGGLHMVVARDGNEVVLEHNELPPEHSCRPAVDPLFRSVAETFGPNALALVLTGMGHDGVQGCRAISDKGGQVIVQDEASSVVWGMPGYVAQAGLAEEILPLRDIAGEIVQRVAAQRPGSRARSSA